MAPVVSASEPLHTRLNCSHWLLDSLIFLHYQH